MIYKQILISVAVILLILFSTKTVLPKTFSDKKPAEITLNHDKMINPLIQLKIIIDNVNKGVVTAYITPEEFNRIQEKGYTIKWIPDFPKTRFKPSNSKTTSSSKKDLLSYPTYNELSDELETIVLSSPSICSLIDGGLSVEGKTLWWVKLSDNVNTEESEPEMHFIGGIHGDEPVGVALSTKLIRYLTTNYPTDSRIRNIIDTTEIWIMPLMNPDGYMVGERWNANGEDLNRSFPVFSPDSPESMQSMIGVEPEVAAIMSWSLNHRSVLSANFHSGALVVNYPFDYTGELCPDNDLFEYIALQYSSNNSPMYNTTNPVTATNGTIRGALWYQIEGGMQDWTYLTTGGNHVTIELSSEKSPNITALQTLWSDNRESMLAYLEAVHCGVKGIVTDVQFGDPLSASIKVDGNTHLVYTDPDVGDFHRLLLPGNYTITIESDGYTPQTQTITIDDNSVSQLDVQLVPVESTDNDFGCFIIAAVK